MPAGLLSKLNFPNEKIGLPHTAHDHGLRQADRLRLQDHFNQAFDHSRALGAFRALRRSSIPAGIRSIGVGTHFAAYQLPAMPAMNLVLKVAHEDFCSDPHQLSKWLRCLERLRHQPIELIAPFAVLQEDERVALVCPYGDGEAAGAQPHWLPLDVLKATFVQQLAKEGLMIADYLQLRCWQGVPFLADMSDLNELKI